MKQVRDALHALAHKDGDILEEIMREVYTDLLAPEARFSVVDGGAHRGLHTFPLAGLPSCRRVYAVEANQDLAVELRSQTRGRRFPAKVEVIAAALQHDPIQRSVSFMHSESHLGRSGISSVFQHDPEVSFTKTVVRATTLDKVAAWRAHPIKFVKLDLEGGEWNAVRGGANVMAKDRPVFAMEHSVYSPEINGYTKDEYLELWDRRGYQPLTFAGERMTLENMHYLWYIWAAPKERAGIVSATLKENVRRRCDR